MLKTKICYTCKRELPATKEYFNSDTTKKDKLHPSCKICRAKKRNKTTAIHSKIKNGKKLCVTCKRWLPATLEYFHKDQKGKNGLHAKCKECREQNFGIVRVNRVLVSPEGYGYCPTCQRLMPIDELFINRNEKYPVCKTCGRQRNARNSNLRRENYILTPKFKRLSMIEWTKCIEYFNGKCAYCGKKTKLTRDHFIPLSKGGNYSVDNIIPVCKCCNSGKQNINFFEWYSRQMFYSKEREYKILKYLARM